MVDKSKFPDATPTTNADWAFDSESRIEDHQRLQVDGFQTGVVSGFTCSFNNPGVDDDVVIDPGYGYTGDVDVGSKVGSQYGSYITTTSQKVVTDPGWVPGTKYYVLLVLDVVDTVERPDEDDNIAVVREESSNQDPTAEVLTETAYNALSDADKHKRIKLAYFVPSSPIVAADMINAWVITRIKTSNQPATITGVEIRDIAPVTPSGTGQLKWDHTTSELSWKAPGDASFGTAVNITADGIYTLQSDTTAYTIDVWATVVLLPAATSPTDDIIISDLYEDVVRPASGADRLLRSYGGSALKTSTNPLGLSASDLGGTGLDLDSHRLLQHDVGIVGSAGALLCSIVKVIAGNDYVLANFLGSSDRFYVAGVEYAVVIGSRRPAGVGLNYSILFDDFNLDNFSMFEVFIDEQGYIDKSQRIKVTSTVLPAIIGVIPLEIHLENDTGAYNLFFDDTNKSLTFDSGEEVFLYPGVDRIYTCVGQNGKDYIKVYVDWSVLATIGSNQTDTWTVINTALGSETEMILSNVCYYQGALYGEASTWGTGGDGDPQDKRIFGTTSLRNLSNDAIEYIADTVADIFNNGVLAGCLMSGATTDTLTVADGEIFIRGKRIVFSSDTYVFTGTGTFHVFIDKDANLQVYDSSSASDEMLNYLAKYMCFLGLTTVGAGPLISTITDRRTKPGIGSHWDVYNDNLLLSQAEGLVIPGYGRQHGGRFYTFGADTYWAFNLIYDPLNDQWSLEDSSIDGYVIMLGSPGVERDGVAPFYMPAGTGPGALSTADIAPEGLRLKGTNYTMIAEKSASGSTSFGAGANYIDTGQGWLHTTKNSTWFVSIGFGNVSAGGQITFDGLRRFDTDSNIFLRIQNLGSAVTVSWRYVLFRLFNRSL